MFSDAPCCGYRIFYRLPGYSDPVMKIRVSVRSFYEDLESEITDVSTYINNSAKNV